MCACGQCPVRFDPSPKRHTYSHMHLSRTLSNHPRSNSTKPYPITTMLWFTLDKICFHWRKTTLVPNSLCVYMSSINYLGTWWFVERTSLKVFLVCVKLLVACHKCTEPAAKKLLPAQIYRPPFVEMIRTEKRASSSYKSCRNIAWTIRHTATDPAIRKITGAQSHKTAASGTTL